MAAAEANKKPRRRIVPLLVSSPTSDRGLGGFGDGEAPAAPALLPARPPQDQRQQSEWAREHLGPERKVFVDLTASQDVDWRKVRAATARCRAVARRGLPPSSGRRLAVGGV